MKYMIKVKMLPPPQVNLQAHIFVGQRRHSDIRILKYWIHNNSNFD